MQRANDRTGGRGGTLARLRPFVRRDVRGRVATALLAAMVLATMAWAGVSALTRVDSRNMRQVRVALGIEHPSSMCGGPAQPRCSFDDRAQARIDRAFRRDVQVAGGPIVKPSVRYHADVPRAVEWQLLGASLFGLAGLVIVVVGPVMTATATAREREAGTLPALQMTGMTPTQLVAAMAIGHNLPTLVCGGALLGGAIPLLLLTLGGPALVAPLLVVGLAGLAGHGIAVGLGDALGLRVGAWLVGASLAAALLVFGGVGSVLVAFHLTATGFLLGPVPSVTSATLQLSGLRQTTHALTAGPETLGAVLLACGLTSLLLLAAICLRSWYRRLEQPWRPLFTPIEGLVLAVATIAATALGVLDLADRIDAHSLHAANGVLSVCLAIALPLLGGVLAISVRRPARPSATTSVDEARRAFLRFQLWLGLTVALVGGAYWAVTQGVELGGRRAEIMWATLAQTLLMAETAAAVVLWASRRTERRLRAWLGGGAVVGLQAASILAVYGFEADYVATFNRSGWPLLVGMDASAHWLLALVLLWAAGFGLILAAILRERDQARAEEEAGSWDQDEDEDDDEDEDENEGHRWLH